MYTVLQSSEFSTWLQALRDPIGKAQVLKRIRSAQLGNFGDHKNVGTGVYEMRIHTGPGYRVYYTRKGELIVWLLHGGDKSNQQRDINKAIELAKTIPE